MRKSELLIFGITLLSFLAAIMLYPQMPEMVASHWNAQGQVDSYMSKFWGLFLMPLFSSGLFLLFLLIPKIDPLKENIQKFRKYYDVFFILIIVFFFYIYLLTLLWNLGKVFNMIVFLLPAMGILFFYAGILIENAKRNWFVGIRTPWTLSSESVWDKTHKIGGKLFKICGLAAFLGIILPGYAIIFILVPMVLTVLFTTVYSYFLYEKEMKQKQE